MLPTTKVDIANAAIAYVEAIKSCDEGAYNPLTHIPATSEEIP